MLEINAILYSGYISVDAKMIHVNYEMGTIDTAKMNSLNLLENLAEVQYIMSDKTGTLTKNELTFVAVCASVNSSYLCGEVSTFEETKKQDMGTYLSDKEDFLKCLTLCHDCTIIELNLPNG